MVIIACIMQIHMVSCVASISFRDRRKKIPSSVGSREWILTVSFFPRKEINMSFDALLWSITLYGPSWSWSYGSWVYNYPCNQCLLPLMLWVRIPLMARCTRYMIKFASALRQVGGFLRVFRFPPAMKLTTTI